MVLLKILRLVIRKISHPIGLIDPGSMTKPIIVSSDGRMVKLIRAYKSL
jgi:hypothetical protein